jgi:hypothetical protein
VETSARTWLALLAIASFAVLAAGSWMVWRGDEGPAPVTPDGRGGAHSGVEPLGHEVGQSDGPREGLASPGQGASVSENSLTARADPASPPVSAGQEPWYRRDLEQRVARFGLDHEPTWEEAHLLVVSAAAAVLERQGRAIRVERPNGFWYHEQTADHSCVTQISPEGGERVYCIERFEFPEFFELQELVSGRRARSILAPPTLSDELERDVRDRAELALDLSQ